MSIDDKTWDRLVVAAKDVATRAYAPYSGFAVGAALLTADDEVILGCNMENATFGATICAEQTAMGSAIIQGKKDFVALAVVTPADHPVAPCGICRQVLAEFCGDLPILLVTNDDQRLHVNLSELLPHRFTSKDF